MQEAIILLLMIWTPLLATVDNTPSQPPNEAERVEPTPWTPDDLLDQEQFGDMQLSPDGRFVAWVKGVSDKEKGERISHLMLYDLQEKREVQLTRGTDSCYAPRWSPDGKQIAFLSSRPQPKPEGGRDEGEDEEPKAQVWLISPSGGEAYPLTSGERGVQALGWRNEDALLFTAQEAPTLYEKKQKEEKEIASVVEDEANEPPVRLFSVSIETKKVTRLTTNSDRIQAFWPSPGGQYAVTIHERSLRYVYDQQIKPVVNLYDLETGKANPVFEDTKYNIAEIYWQHDSKGFYATSDFTTHPKLVMASIREVYHYDMKTDNIEKVELDWPNGLSFGLFGNNLQVTSNGFLALLANGARNKIARYTRQKESWKREWLDSKMDKVFGFALGKDGKTFLYFYSTSSLIGQAYHAQLHGTKLQAPEVITKLNEHLKEKRFAKTELVRWKGSQNEEIEGILYYPHGYEPGKRYPLVVMIHGGPFWADFDYWDDSWFYPANMFCERGAFVLKPNYHGSSNYGLSFAESIADGKYYDLPVMDIEKGVDYLVERGWVDREQMGVMGWSNGAILSLALIADSPRFKAASAGAGGAEWIADWAVCAFGDSFDRYYFGKSPLEDPMLYIQNAPIFKFDRVKTPTILFQGTADTAVPPHHGWMVYRALQQAAKVEVRYLTFAGEPHGFGKRVNQKRKLEEELAWFDRHLFNKPAPENPLYQPDSPLAIELTLQQAKREGSRYGLTVKNKLIPETVAYKGLDIGRFEVTQAQFAQFAPNYPVEFGKENYPANHILFDQAQAYCKWLTELTGDYYRLPDEEEAKTLYEEPGDVENTLDYWAGHSVNPDDAARLREKLSTLPGHAPLLKPVGSFPPVEKEVGVFDLGGNVAEWCLGKKGKGFLAGDCADQPAETYAKGQHSPNERVVEPAYTGFRVVKEKKKVDR
jgi:dipeptidyl aminopeptidase/acylaminoacyl peptidase